MGDLEGHPSGVSRAADARIQVMDAGRAAEFASPKELLANKGSIFSSMVKETGRATAKMLRSVAAGASTISDTRTAAVRRATESTTRDAPSFNGLQLTEQIVRDTEEAEAMLRSLVQVMEDQVRLPAHIGCLSHRPARRFACTHASCPISPAVQPSSLRACVQEQTQRIVDRYASMDLHGEHAPEAGSAGGSDLATNLAALSTVMARVKQRLAAMQQRVQAPLEAITIDCATVPCPADAGPSTAAAAAVNGAPEGKLVSSSVFEGAEPASRFRASVHSVQLLNRANRRLLAAGSASKGGVTGMSRDADAPVAHEGAVEGAADFA